jgi:histidine triad (HIT) family protein
MTPYDPQNIFAKILRGEIPCFKVYEDEKTFAFLDIMPRAPGHTLVIPKAPARNILDIDPDDLSACIRTAKRIARAGQTAFAADGITLSQYSEPAGGQEVFHLHFHVIPRHAGVSMKPAASIREDMAVLKEHAAKLTAALQAM